MANNDYNTISNNSTTSTSSKPTTPSSSSSSSSDYRSDSSSTWVIIIIAIVLILIFWIFILFTIKANPESSDSELVVRCAPGQCATNLINGEKLCPLNQEDSISINPGLEACNSPFTCENVRTPYALQSDGSTNEYGICQENTICRCLKEPQCGYYIPVIFSARNGNTQEPINSQRIFFEQTTGLVNINKNFVNTPPISLRSNTNQFCQIPSDWAGRAWPPILNNENKLGICVEGIPAFIPNNIDDVNINTINLQPLACVNGSYDTCAPGYTSLWNKKEDTLYCKQICNGKDLIYDYDTNRFICQQ